MLQAPFSVVETRWWKDGNHSVRPLFESVAALQYDNPSAFLYDMFCDESSLSTIMHQRCSDGATEVVYLATHGNEEATAIGQNEDTAITRTKFRNVMRSANKKKQLSGMFLGTCYTAKNKTIEFLLDGGGTKMSWMAGYTEEVDWIEGSAIDIVFFNYLAQEYKRNRSRKNGKKSPVEMAKTAATELIKLIPSAHFKYGFNFYHLEGKEIRSMFDGK